jgi:hypothetical protein
MKISKRQALQLFDIVCSAAGIRSYLGGWSAHDRAELIREIMAQQEELHSLGVDAGHPDTVDLMRQALRREGIVEQTMGTVEPSVLVSQEKEGAPEPYCYDEDEQRQPGKAAYDW